MSTSARSRNRYKSFCLGLPFAVAAGILLQFFLFHWDAVYSLSLKSYLYDQATWVQTPPSVVIMGSSIARYGVVSRIIAKNNHQVVNLGVDAGPLLKCTTRT
jgi:hypothetical protein